MKKACLTIIAACTSVASFAQMNADTTRQKRYTHQVGVQINELFRQIFNFNGNPSSNTNSYLLTYSINSIRTGWGLRAGVGYSYQSFTDDDGITRKTSDLNDLHSRLGVEKMFWLSSKWTAGAGIDGVMNRNDDYTKSMVRNFDTVTTVTTTKITSYGGGAMLWLRYHLSSKVLIGTETSFYYTSGQENSTISITQREFVPGGGQQLVTTSSDVDNQRIDAKFSIPMAFFLIVRF